MTSDDLLSVYFVQKIEELDFHPIENLLHPFIIWSDTSKGRVVDCAQMVVLGTWLLVNNSAILAGAQPMDGI